MDNNSFYTFILIIISISAQEVTDTNKYRVSSCDNPPCKLKKKTNVTAEFKFVASK